MRNTLRDESVARRLDRRVFEYFRTGTRITITQTFTPGTGWQDWTRYRKGITASWARKLRKAGVTAVALTDGRRVADFTLVELLGARRAKWARA